MVASDFITAISQLSAEKNLETHTVLAAVEAAMASALKKDELQYAELEVKIDPDSGDIDLWRLYEVMADDDIEDDELQVSPERAAGMGLLSVTSTTSSYASSVNVSGGIGIGCPAAIVPTTGTRIVRARLPPAASSSIARETSRSRRIRPFSSSRFKL